MTAQMLLQDWERASTLTASSFHEQVLAVLRTLGLQSEVEYRTADSLLSIDIAFPDQMVALEVDGPQHFFVNTLRPTGAACQTCTICFCSLLHTTANLPASCRQDRSPQHAAAGAWVDRDQRSQL